MYRVLIVDDERLIRSSILQRINWEDLGLEVDGMAANGVEALDFICSRHPHIVLVDIRMPLMDGLALIREARAVYDRPIRFVILSGYNDFSYARQAIQLGVSDYIQKPVDEEELGTALEKVIRRLHEEYASGSQRINESPAAGQLPRASADEAVERVRRHIDLHFDQPLMLADLASVAHLNPSYLSEVFRLRTGMRLTEYIESLRIAKSRELLGRGRMSVVDAAARVGYQDANYFSKVFRKNTGISPTQYQRAFQMERPS